MRPRRSRGVRPPSRPPAGERSKAGRLTRMKRPLRPASTAEIQTRGGSAYNALSLCRPFRISPAAAGDGFSSSESSGAASHRPPSLRQARPGHGLDRSISCSGRPHSWSPGRRAESCKCSVASPRTGTTSPGLTAGVQPSSKAVVRPRSVRRGGPQPRRVPLRAKEPRFGPNTRQRPRRIFPCRGGSGRRPCRDVRPGP